MSELNVVCGGLAYAALATYAKIKHTQRREPLICTPLPGRPWEKVAADICQWKKDNFLVVVDYFSRYIEIAHLTNMLAATTIASLRNIFARWGAVYTITPWAIPCGHDPEVPYHTAPYCGGSPIPHHPNYHTQYKNNNNNSFSVM